MYLKSLKGFLWSLCAITNQGTQVYCKEKVEFGIDKLNAHIYSIILSPSFLCGYLVPLCSSGDFTDFVTYQEQLVADYANKRDDISEPYTDCEGRNDCLNDLYE
mmetsp:Transcript_5152/g.7922  ORF Transcript_5152/g.7922 Transcript_5152/m.7922 type:complete len:104 (+) Transcript_5152:244-555(+)